MKETRQYRHLAFGTGLQWIIVLLFPLLAPAQHPAIYANAADKPAIVAKIKNEPWAKAAWDNLLKSIDPYVTRHLADSAWITSRLAMYWKPGEHYTQCYLKNQNWDRGEGNAPVPTVRMPGMRTWNEYTNVRLEDRTPYNETGDMKATSRAHPERGVVAVPYKQSGHLVRGNNIEILTLAEKAAFAYWITGEEKCARFAAAIFNTWVAGTYFMQPILDPEESCGSYGGYQPGGIAGYYDYEQIHDDLQTHAAPVYDFLYDYLQAHSATVQGVTGKTISEVADTVFKRFVNIGMVRGGKKGNWNVNGWHVMMPSILVLRPNGFYPDGRGREYYLRFFTTTSTDYHDALPDILSAYDPVTGLWGESPGYAFGTVTALLDMVLPLLHTGTDIMKGNAMLQKAALAVFPWMDARGNLVNFGDGRGGPGDYAAFENLLAYYSQTGDTANAAIAAAVIQAGVDARQYIRNRSGYTGLCLNTPALPVNHSATGYYRTAYSPLHRHLTLKNGNDRNSGLMATLYGGYPREKHLSANGLALQLYGLGWALAPDASGYESYWTADYAYHQTATGSNTILPGYTSGPITINGLEPSPDSGSFTSRTAISPYCSFADVSAAEKRRMVAIIRTSPTTGYYVDVFRSKQADNDYLYHNLGNTLLLTDTSGKALPMQPATLDTSYSAAYSYFKNVQLTGTGNDFLARWIITAAKPGIEMTMWMKGEKNRLVYKMDAPYTSLINSVTPAQVNVAPATTPAIIVRQNSADGWRLPFVGVFEPSQKGENAIRNIMALPGTESFTALKIDSRPAGNPPQGRTDWVFYAIDGTDHPVYTNGRMTLFNGMFGTISEDSNGFRHFYLGRGRTLATDDYGIYAADPANDSLSASLTVSTHAISYSANSKVKIRLPVPIVTKGKKWQVLYTTGGDTKAAIPIVYENNSKQLAAFLPAGNNVSVIVAQQ